MKRKLGLLIALAIITLAVHAQNIVAIKGKVTDKTGAPVNDAQVHLLNTNIVAFTDKNGNFTIKSVFAGSYTFTVNAVGFATVDKLVNVSDNENIAFTLEDAVNNLDAVVVTAEKREALLQDLPVSTTAISAKQAEQYRLWNSDQLTAIVPNLYSANSGDIRNVTGIRGIFTTSYDPAVATYIDGVNQFNLDTYIATLLDVERIEVLRGPQGTLYGRNAMGGVINIITKQPTNNASGTVQVDIGNYHQQRYSYAFRAPLIKDKLFFGIAGVYNKRNGFYTNDFTKTSYDKQNTFTGNYYLKYIPYAKWDITLNVKHQNNRSNGAFPLAGSVEDAFANPYHISQNATAKMIDNTWNASLSVNYAGEHINFTSQSAWQNNHRYYNAPLDGDFSPLDAVTIFNNYGNDWNNVQAATQEFRITSPSNKTNALKWTAGAYFFYQYNPVKQATHYGEDAGLLGVPDVNFSTINTTKGKNTGAALYGQLEYALTSKLNVIGGLRYDYENKQLTVHEDYMKDGTDAFTILPDTTAKADFNAFSPKLGLTYKASKSSNVYATYTRGYRTGGLTQLGQDPSQPPLYPYKPEYSNNIELGLKNQFLNNKLTLNVAAFITKVTDAQVPTLVLPEAITITKNTGKLTSKGVEAEVAATPVKGLQLNYSFGYTDASYKSLKISSNGEAVDLNGKKQIFTPDVTSMLAAQYSFVFDRKSQLQLVLRGEWKYLGEQYFDLANNIRQSPYNMLNTRVGVSSKYASIFFWGQNLTNQKYIAYAYDFGAVHLGNPKTYGITLQVKF